MANYEEKEDESGNEENYNRAIFDAGNGNSHLKICQYIPISRTCVGRGDKQNKDQERKS